jgi:hypothetical protein
MLSHIIYNNGIKGDGKKPPRLIPSVILDFNRKSSDHIESLASLFVGESVKVVRSKNCHSWSFFSLLSKASMFDSKFRGNHLSNSD